MEWTYSNYTVGPSSMHLQSNLTLNLTSDAVVGASGPGGATAANATNGTTKEPAATSSDCDDWQDAQHVLYQLANLCLTVAFILPYSFQYHALCMRGILLLASLFLVIWGGSVVCNADVLGWYTAFLMINLAYFFYAAYATYPVSFHPELEELYLRMFKPLQVSRNQFRELTACGHVKELPSGATYALEGATHVRQKLSILLRGRLKVTCEQMLLHTIQPNQFVDSPEYETVPSNTITPDNFQVSISALEDSRLLTWYCHDLHQYLETQSWMSSLLTVLLGKDITHKLHQVQELLLRNPQYVRIITSQCSLLQLRHQQMLQQHGGSGSSGVNTLLIPPTSPDSLSSAGSKGHLAMPARPGSPSQLSWETSV